jgi:hypothetical protein
MVSTARDASQHRGASAKGKVRNVLRSCASAASASVRDGRTGSLSLGTPQHQRPVARS